VKRERGAFQSRSFALWLLVLASGSACHGEAQKATPAVTVEAGPCADSATASANASSDAGVLSHAVLTEHNDVGRTGATLTETALDTCSVAGLTELGTYAVDGEVYAQPLYAEGVATEGGTKNLLVVATMADSLFAFDADAPASAPVWQLGQDHELGVPAFSARNVAGNNGILATPVIDPSSGSVFVVSRDCDPSYPPENPHCQQRLFAIELASGKILQSVNVAGSVMNAGATLPTFFDPSLHWSRSALLLQQGRVFVSFGSGPNGNAHEEDFAFHGWLFGYSASDLSTAPTVYCSTPDFGGGAIWQSGNGPAADDNAIYFATGNGIHQPTPALAADFPTIPQGDEDCVVRVPLAAPTTSTRYWDDRPYQSDGNVFQYMEKNDIDLGTAGPLLIPDSSRLIAGGKSGILYVLDRLTLRPTQDPLEVFSAPALSAGQTKYVYSYDGGPQVHGSPVFFRPNDADGGAGSGLIFYWPANDRLKSFDYDYESGVITELGTADVPIVASGGVLSLSASGSRSDSAILWASAVDADDGGGHLWALSATTLGRLWDAKLPAWAKFAVPTVAAGRVYLASTSSKPGTNPVIAVFGLSH
jgi:hypothetical protein